LHEFISAMADDRPPHALVPAGLLPIHRPRRLCSGRTIPVLGEPAT
jgi:hypothetical protein